MRFTYETILRHKTNGYAEYRIPGIVEHKGEAVMCAECRASSRDDWGRVDIIIFGEEGQRHKFVPMGHEAGENETCALCPGDTLNNPTFISDGDILRLIFHVNYRDVMYTTSTDGGRSWAPLTDITYAYREFPYEWNVSATGPGHGIALDNGRLLVPIWLADGEVVEGEGYRIRHHPSVSGAVYSDDKGRTWHAGAMFTDMGEMVDCNETCCVQLTDGSVLFNIRHIGEIRHRALGISMDGGATAIWQQVDMALEDPICFGSMAKREGEVYFTNCHTIKNRINLGVKKMARGNWEHVAHIDDIGGYSDCAFVNGKLWVLYEHTVDGSIPEMLLAKEV